jgi:hypothetical protein
MDSTSANPKKAEDESSKQPLLTWLVLPEFALFTFSIGGVFALYNLYSHEQTVTGCFFRGAFMSAFIVLGRLIQERWRRSLRSRT